MMKVLITIESKGLHDIDIKRGIIVTTKLRSAIAINQLSFWFDRIKHTLTNEISGIFVKHLFNNNII